MLTIVWFGLWGHCVASSPSICEKLARTLGALGPDSFSFTTRVKDLMMAVVSLMGEPQEPVISPWTSLSRGGLS